MSYSDMHDKRYHTSISFHDIVAAFMPNDHWCLYTLARLQTPTAFEWYETYEIVEI